MNSDLNKILKVCLDLNLKPSKYLITISICEQKLRLFEEKNCIATYNISTSRKPPSCESGSLGTPTGLHIIDGKIGDGVAPRTVFRGRIADGLVEEQSQEEQKKNLITTRIMRLRGLEEGKNSGGNVDTYARYVYIHGTNQEDKIGTPNSHGCVLLKNDDIIKLFDVVSDRSLVLIY